METIDHKTKLGNLIALYGWKILKYKNENDYTIASGGIDVTIKVEDHVYDYRIFGSSYEMPAITESMVVEIENL